MSYGKWLVVAISALVIAGCASLKAVDAEPENQRADSAYWQLVRQAMLPNVAAPLGALERAVKKWEFQGGGAATVNARDMLRAIIGSTDEPEVVPDPAFSRLDQALRGDDHAQQAVFAEALADYLTSSGFACRQPLYQEYFQQRYGALHSSPVCRGVLPIWQIDNESGGKPSFIDPSRVRAIHLLFAGSSENLASRFGHVALRLIICPAENSTDEECDRNLSEHLVLGFRANVDELSISYIKALTGHYRSYLFALPFIDVVEEYTVGEFRELFSVPLEVTPDELERVVRGLAHIHWKFNGEYRFFSENCATQLQDALNIVLPKQASDLLGNDRFSRPDSFFKYARSTRLLRGEAIAELAQAERRGNYFPSTEKYYNQALSDIAKGQKGQEPGTLDSYLGTNPLKRRNNWTADMHAMVQHDQRLLNAYLILEEYAVTRALRQLVVEMTQLIDSAGVEESDLKSLNLDDRQKMVFETCLVRRIRARLAPKHDDRGIPSIETLDIGEDSGAKFCSEPEIRRRLADALKSIIQINPDVRARLDELATYLELSSENVKFLSDALGSSTRTSGEKITSN